MPKESGVDNETLETTEIVEIAPEQQNLPGAGNNHILEQYLKHISKIPLLTEEEEQNLTRSYKISQDLGKRNQLVRQNLRLVTNIAKRYAYSSDKLIELIQEGNIGLIRAAERFDPGLNYRFSTYATWWIRQAILSFLNKEERTIRLPGSILENLQKIRKVQEQLYKELSREPTMSEVGEVFEFPAKKMQRIGLVGEQMENLVSLDLPLKSEDGSESTLLESISDELSRLPEEQAELEIFREELQLALEKVLTRREASIIKLRYGLNLSGESLSLLRLSQLFQVSIERIRQLERASLKKLANYMLY